MVTRDSAPFPADRHVASGGLIRLHAARWVLKHKLSRRTRADFAGMVFKGVAIRLYSAAACFISMLLVAWVGAFARIVSANDWRVFRALDGRTLLTASAQAARYQGSLLPVLILWAVLLLLTPTGYTLAFRSAAMAAGILGFLHFSPPSFLITTRVTAVSHWLSTFSGHGAVPYLILAIAMAYVLLSSAVGAFGRLDDVHRKAHRVPYGGPSSFDFTRRMCAVPLILLVLLSVTWAVTVVRLAASGASRPGAEISYGLQGGLYQSKYLLVLVILSIAVSRITIDRKWLIVAVILAALYSLAPGALPFPSTLEISAGKGQLIHIGTAWGPDSLWAALFIFIPAVVLGIYLVARLLRLP